MFFPFLTITVQAIAHPSSSIGSSAVSSSPVLLALNERHPAYGMKMVFENPPLDLSTGRSNDNKSHPVSMGMEEIPSWVEMDIRNLQELIGGESQQPFQRNWRLIPSKNKVSQLPWPSSYWPTYQDGINFRWNYSDLSAAEKYAAAFDLNSQTLQNLISFKSGIDSQPFNEKCKDRRHRCADSSATCSIRRGKKEGYCIPTWFGICHAWAPAAMLEREPKCPVRINNVTFQPLDLKALISQVYDGANIDTVFTGQRCNQNLDSRGDTTKLDQYGRLLDEECRDISPAFFHLVVGNLIGLLNKSFVADVDGSAPVWNQPSRGYEITSQNLIDVAEASRYLSPISNNASSTTPSWPFNPAAKKFLLVSTRFDYIVENFSNEVGLAEDSTSSRDYEYILELNDAEEIVGGEWINDSKEDHIDFLWLPVGKPKENAVVVGGIKYSVVRDLLARSVAGTC